MVTASIVSHGHGQMVADLARDLVACEQVGRIIITQNVSEETNYPKDRRIEIIRNASPRGYGSNQNAAFAGVATPFFCVLNPDIRLKGNPFPALLAALEDKQVAASAPVIITPGGEVEDSARKFPTVVSLLCKAAGILDGTYDSSCARENPDWLAGMFLLLRSSAFREVDGFDERYFLYYEDVDLCWRLRRAGDDLRQMQEVKAIHDARRASRSDWQHARWHLASMAKFLWRSTRG